MTSATRGARCCRIRRSRQTWSWPSVAIVFPDAQLDALLDLKGRVRRKLALAATSSARPSASASIFDSSPREPEDEIVGELGTCLRLLDSSAQTPRVLGEEMRLAAYDARRRARRSIFDAWTFETDPANLQPRVRKLNREVAAFLRENPPSDVDRERLNRCLEAIEAPWPRREEKLLRVVWDVQFATNQEKARRLIEAVERIGAEPFHPPLRSPRSRRATST